MPLNYGTPFEPPQLRSGTVGIIVPTSSGSLAESILSILTFIGEGVLSFIAPEFAPIFALGGAAGRLGIEAGYGDTISPVSTAIDFASAVVPGVFQVAGNVAKAGRIEEQGLSLVESLERSSSAYSGWETRYTNMGLLEKAQGSLIRSDVNASAAELLGNTPVQRTLFQDPAQVFINNFRSGVDPAWLEHLSPAFTGALRNTKLAGTAIGARAVAGGGEVVELGEKVDDLIVKARELGLSDEFINELREALQAQWSYTSIRSLFIDELIQQLGQQKALVEVLKLEESIANQAVARGLEAAEWAALRDGAVVTYFKRLGKAIRKPGSGEFNDLVLQPIQNFFDGNDAGRYLVEQAYQVAKKDFVELLKTFKDIDKAVNKIDDIFEKTGGTLVNSQVIVGYKIIREALTPLGHNTVMIKFYPDATKNKKPVFVKATAIQLEELIIGGMAYYLKHWAISKGGARGNAFLRQFGFMNNLSPEVGNILSLLPIQAIRNLESLASNISSAIWSKQGFKWSGLGSEAYFKKIPTTLVRTTEARLTRFFSRVVIGGVAEAKIGGALGQFIAKESQRIGSTTLNATKASLSATKYSRLSTGQRFAQAFEGAALTSVRGQVVRANRGRGFFKGSGTTNFAQSQSFSRNLNILQRPPSSLSGGQFQLTGLGKIKL